MTMPYRVTIALPLSPEQKGIVSETIQLTFQEIDKTCNNWNPDSEISRLNRAPSHQPFSLSPSLRFLLQLSEELYHLSHHRFDPTVEPLVTFFRTSSLPPPASLCQSIGFHHLLLTSTTITKLKEETRLDLCALSKGHCIDLIIERLLKLGYSNLLVEWAGELAARGHPDNRPHWLIQIDPGHPLSSDPIPLVNQAIATSGRTAYNRSFIIDPLTHCPISCPFSAVTVIAPSCALADALATAAITFATLEEAKQFASLFPPSITFFFFSPVQEKI